MSSLNEVLEKAEDLSEEYQEMLIDILQNRIAEKVRRQYSIAGKKARKDFLMGKLKPMTAVEAVTELKHLITQ